MNPPNGFFRRYAASLVALGVVAVCMAFSRFPHLEVTEAKTLAARFQFDRQTLPEVPNHPPHTKVCAVRGLSLHVWGWWKGVRRVPAVEVEKPVEAPGAMLVMKG